MRSIFASVAIAATVATLSAPAFAKSADTTATSTEQVVLKSSADGKFCTATRMVTGSILPQKVCKTRAEWMADTKTAR